MDGCNVCNGTVNRLVKGFNDIQTVLPNVAKLFKDRKLAEDNTRGSKKEAVFICPDCGREVVKKINTVCVHGLSCPCKDKYSYPNKFLYSVLEQIHTPFKIEKTFEWSMGRRYDAYITKDEKKIIVEMNGGQHYDKQIRAHGHCRSVSEEQANDLLKQQLALSNGIDYYFAIDCRKSELMYVKDSIISSGLLDALKVSKSDIDWELCDEFATSNLAKEICNRYSSNCASIVEIAKEFNLCERTVRRFLRVGSKFGWCNYDGKQSSLNNLNGRSAKKAVYCKTINKKFDSAKDAATYLNLPDAKHGGRSIRNSIKYGRPYLGYEFEYLL